jgi:hypothetical protein
MNVVFTGPTLPAAEAMAAFDCMALPPARQGDVWRAIRAHQPAAIGLIDGVFLHEPAVWHREILWALSQGVHVFGAASMGALRAAELAAFGMRGTGKIYTAFRDGAWPGFDEPFEDDDEVAVIHAPAAAGGHALSDAMVDLRDTLLAAEAAGVIDRAARDALCAALKHLPFPERGFAALARLGGERLAGWLPAGRVPRKRLDALDLLRQMAAFLANDPPPFVPAFRFANAQVWDDFVAGAARAASDEESLVIGELRLRPAAWTDAARAGLGRLHAAASVPPPPDSERAAFAGLRGRLGLARRADVDAWLDANAAGPPVLARLLHDEAALAAALDAPPPGLDAAIADHLRLTGQFAGLLARARAKQAALSGRPAPAAGPELDAALAWFDERHGPWGAMARDVWRPANEAHFRAAVWREYVFAGKGTP